MTADRTLGKLWRDDVPEIITAAWLREHDACGDQVEQFAALFPDGAPITVATIRACTQLDISWFITNAATEPLWEEYHVTMMLLLAQYETAIAPLRAEYRARMAPFVARYDAAAAPLLTQYHVGLAEWLAHRIEQEEETKT